MNAPANIRHLQSNSLGQMLRDACVARQIANAREAACIHDDHIACELELAAVERGRDLVAYLKSEEAVDAKTLIEVLLS